MSQENNEETSQERDQTTQDWVTGVKERKELQDKLKEKERECNELKGRLYDMTKKMEELGKPPAEKNKAETKKRRPSSARKPKRPAQKKREKGKDAGLLAPGVNGKVHDDPFEDPEKLYASIAQTYPDLPLSTVLFAEKKFVEADLDRNGTVDSDELEKMLDLLSQQGNSGFLYTKKEVKDIFRKIDVDNTNSIDFLECLGVLDLMRQNRNTDLPTSLVLQQQQNKSAVCSIQ